MPLGENIKKKRNELKMSQEDLAGALGVSRQAVSKWETGQSEPSAKNLRELSGIFHISLTELMDSQQGKAEQPPQEINQKESHFKLLCCRWLGYIFLITGYSGYAGYYNSDLPKFYWLAVFALGFVLVTITSVRYFRKAKMQPLQLVLGIILICAIFFLPAVIPLENGLNVLIGHFVSFAAIALLNLLYWRYVWNDK